MERILAGPFLTINLTQLHIMHYNFAHIYTSKAIIISKCPAYTWPEDSLGEVHDHSFHNSIIANGFLKLSLSKQSVKAVRLWPAKVSQTVTCWDVSDVHCVYFMIYIYWQSMSVIQSCLLDNVSPLYLSSNKPIERQKCDVIWSDMGVSWLLLLRWRLE